MSLRKAISYTAFGFLFVFVNFNLQFSGLTINIMPAFIGWILLFLSYGPYGDYMKGKSYMLWIPLVMTVAEGTIWFLGIAKSELMESQGIHIFSMIINIVSAVYWYLMFTILEKVADDNGTTRGPSIRVIKILSLILYIAINLCTLLTGVVDLALLGAVVLIGGIGLLVLVVVALVVLFGLRKEIRAANEI